MTHAAIIITRNRSDELRRCVASLAAQTLSPDIIIIVDASAQPVAADALGVAADVQVRVVAALPGICAQRNIGLEHADADIVSFFDDDVVVDAGYCAAVMEVFAQDVRAEVAGIGGVIVDARKMRGAELFLRRMFLLQTARGVSRFRVSGVPDVGYECRDVTTVPFAATTAVSYRRSAVGDVRFDDRELGGAAMGLPTGRVFGEDLLFSMEVAQRGGRILMLPAARCEHRPSAQNREDVFVTQALYVRSLRVLSRRAVRGVLRGAARSWALAGQLLLCGVQAVHHRDGGYLRGWWRAMTR